MQQLEQNCETPVKNEEINSVITPFIIHVVLKHVGLSWIIDNNKHLNFDIEV